MTQTFDKKSALAFIVAFGIVSLFADMAYEGMRGITGPYLALLGASGTAVGIIAGTGELAGYLLRLASGRLVARWLLFDLARRRDEYNVADYRSKTQAMEERLDDWLEANLQRRTRSADLDRLDAHIRAHRGEWLVFLHDSDVPPTNNHAEQMLRPAVITRKVGGCNKTLLGALVHGILASLMVTCKRRGQSFLEFAKGLWQAGQPQILPLATVD